MPETMSLREKVGYDPSLSNEENYRRFKAHVESLVGAPSAVASSGDHAELARTCEEALIPMPEKRRKSWFNRQNRFRDAANPATVLSLIAENAALRDDLNRKHEACQIAQDQAMENGSRATEAERKLAEAVRHMRWMRDHIHAWAVTEDRLSEINTFLSKGAERG